MIRFFRKYHKWVALIFSFFILMFCFSGILLNHRRVISSASISRGCLPASYRYQNWNNNALKGDIKITPDSVLLYGGSGIWLADSAYNNLSEYTKGIKKGADNRLTGNIIKTEDNEVFSVTTFDIYQLNRDNRDWTNISHLIDSNERFCDLATKADTLVLLTRSHLFYATSPYREFTKVEIPAPENLPNKVTLFRTLWTLHSGELFGIFGQLFVDFMGILLIILTITGIIFTMSPKIMKKMSKKGVSISGIKSFWKKSTSYHNRIGSFFFYLIMILIVSGTFLRPPLLIAIIKLSTPPVPGSTLDSKNRWHDKLRVIRHDKHKDEWIIYSSSGFFTIKNIGDTPEKIEKTPPISVMGVTVMQQLSPDKWAVGSFNGLVLWDRDSGNSVDYLLRQPIGIKSAGRPDPTVAVNGFISDYKGEDVIFSYIAGAESTSENNSFIEMPKEIKYGDMSLWQLCLEIHVGRIYSPILGIVSELFVFLSGAIMIFIMISGKKIYDKRKKRKNKH